MFSDEIIRKAEASRKRKRFRENLPRRLNKRRQQKAGIIVGLGYYVKGDPVRDFMMGNKREKRKAK